MGDFVAIAAFRDVPAPETLHWWKVDVTRALAQAAGARLVIPGYKV